MICKDSFSSLKQDNGLIFSQIQLGQTSGKGDILIPRRKEHKRSELKIKLAWRKAKKKKMMKKTGLFYKWEYGDLICLYLLKKAHGFPTPDPYRASRQFERFIFKGVSQYPRRIKSRI